MTTYQFQRYTVHHNINVFIWTQLEESNDIKNRSNFSKKQFSVCRPILCIHNH